MQAGSLDLFSGTSWRSAKKMSNAYFHLDIMSYLHNI